VPIYDYICSNCRQRTEFIHGIHEPGPRFCPACGAEGTLTKAFSTPAVHFKGSGWAKKDRSSTSSGTRTKAANASSSSDGSGSGRAGGSAGSGGSTGGPDGGDAGASSSSEAPKPAPSSED
jgi:putative FmdB family regulatory protein